MADLLVDALRFTRASAELRASGMLGWVQFVLNGRLVVDGVALRRTRAGVLALAFPETRDARGCRRAPVRPLNDQARRELERQVLGLIDAAEVAL